MEDRELSPVEPYGVNDTSHCFIGKHSHKQTVDPEAEGEHEKIRNRHNKDDAEYLGDKHPDGITVSADGVAADYVDCTRDHGKRRDDQQRCSGCNQIRVWSKDRFDLFGQDDERVS